MFRSKKKLAASVILVELVCLPLVVVAQDIESRLARKADFVPNDKSTLDRIVAIAKHYEIPMGIEWIGGVGSQRLEVPVPADPGAYTVRDLLTAIVSRLPDYQLTIENGVVHIAPPVIAVRKDNLLNLVIEEFQVEDENLFGAKHQLAVAIEMTLHPEIEGYAGGYGHAPDHVFVKRIFSFKSDDFTVRQILDGLIRANGNALWIAEFDRTLKQQWRFVPLNEMSLNAK